MFVKLLRREGGGGGRKGRTGSGERGEIFCDLLSASPTLVPAGMSLKFKKKEGYGGLNITNLCFLPVLSFSLKPSFGNLNL